MSNSLRMFSLVAVSSRWLIVSCNPNFTSLCEEKLGNDKKEPDMKIWKKEKRLDHVDFTSSDWIFTPIIQSGGIYDLKVSAESTDAALTPGVIIASMGIKYKEYCSSIGRTFMISPHKVSEVDSVLGAIVLICNVVVSQSVSRAELPIPSGATTDNLEEDEGWSPAQGAI